MTQHLLWGPLDDEVASERTLFQNKDLLGMLCDLDGSGLHGEEDTTEVLTLDTEEAAVLLTNLYR